MPASTAVIPYLEDIRRLYSRGRLIPFVGAGASMSVSWTVDGVIKRGPSWSELVDEAASILGFQPRLIRARGTDLQILEFYRNTEQNFARLQNWMARELHPPDEALRTSPIHLALASMLLSPYVYTTNYDDFIERSFALQGRTAVSIANEGDIANRLRDHPRDVCEIVKFHGDLNRPDVMVVSESDYLRRLQLRDMLDFRLRSDLRGRALLFVGYSFNDWNVSYLFHAVSSEWGPLPGSAPGLRGYILLADPSNFERELFESRRIGVIPISGESKADDIRNVLDKVRV